MAWIGAEAAKAYLEQTKPELIQANNTSGLPAQGPVTGNVEGAPPVDAGQQGKHVPGHPNSMPGEKTQWPEGETGVDLTQEAWTKGRQTPNPNVRVWDSGRVVGPNGETGVNVKYNPSTGLIHGYPVFPK